MSIKGGNVEQKDIGITIGTDGTFVNTAINNGNVELTKIEGTEYYHKEGEWISKAVDIGDEFKSFGKVFVTNINTEKSKIEVYTRTSDDNVTFDEWVAVGDTSDILSIKRRYISIKVVFHSGTELVDNYISQFDDSNDSEMFYNGSFIDTAEGLKLKREYSYQMDLDSNWTDSGSLSRKLISDAEFMRIDKLKINNIESQTVSSFILNNGEYKKWNEAIPPSIEGSAIPVMTSNTSPSGEASASSSRIGNEAWKAFNGVVDIEGWHVSDGISGWLKYKFAYKKIIFKYSIANYVNYPDSAPNTWTFEGSNDDVNWDILDTRVNQTNWTNNVWNEYTIDNPAPYLAYRINVTNNNGYPAMAIGEVRMYSHYSQGELPSWSAVTNDVPTASEFIKDGMKSLSPILNRDLKKLEPIRMEINNEAPIVEEGNIFSKIISLKKYLDIKKIELEVK